MSYLRTLRTLALPLALGVFATLTPGCSVETGGESEADGPSTSDITQLDQSAVKRQSIGNCWIYAIHSWVESLNKRSTGVELNLSESYVTYWHWFEQIANRSVGKELETGGSYGVATDLIIRYGMMAEGDFLPSEANAEMSGIQKSALLAMNASITTGALKDPAARRNRALVRSELDKAFGLLPEVRANLDAVFGADVSKTLDRSYKSAAPGKGVLRATDIPAAIPDAVTHQVAKVTLADAIGTPSTASTILRMTPIAASFKSASKKHCTTRRR
jgi:hypothetical protein